MDVRTVLSAFLLISAAMAAQQAAAPAPTSDDLGFSYHIPSGWAAIDTQSSLPEVKQRQLENAKTDEEKKGIACIQVPISARKGPPPSFLTAMALPYDCYGQIMTDKDLPGFAEGASEGPRAVFDFGEPTFGSYSLGKHKIWIERANGNPKGHPEMAYTLEIACGLLKRAAVCWMTVAADRESLKSFEENAVTLDGDFFAEFIPTTAFEKKPAAQ
ncbi:MAG TPA: hypothetical protein VGF82_04185 [Terracidiphilus sp.]|jgi:hypothetical protein